MADNHNASSAMPGSGGGGTSDAAPGNESRTENPGGLGGSMMTNDNDNDAAVPGGETQQGDKAVESDSSDEESGDKESDEEDELAMTHKQFIALLQTNADTISFLVHELSASREALITELQEAKTTAEQKAKAAEEKAAHLQKQLDETELKYAEVKGRLEERAKHEEYNKKLMLTLEEAIAKVDEEARRLQRLTQTFEKNMSAFLAREEDEDL